MVLLSIGATRCNQRGVALVLVLWMGALISVMATSFAFSVRTEVRLSTGAVERAQAGALAEAGLHRAIVGLAQSDQGQRWSAGGQPYEWAFAGSEVSISVAAETGKIDINAAPLALLEGLVSVVLTSVPNGSEYDSKAIAAAISDWRDANHDVHSSGAEDQHYRAAGLTYEAGDRAFLAVSELQRVFGMTPELFEQIKTSVTVHTWSARVDPTTASRTVLLALPGVNPGKVDAFLDERAQILDTVGSTRAQFRAGKRKILIAARSLSSTGRRHLASTNASVYTLVSRGRLPGGASAVRKAVVRVSASKRVPYQILSWSESATFPTTAANPPDGRPPTDGVRVEAG